MTMAAQGSDIIAENRLAGRKPRFALMGEFSAGKSTLANLMAGADRLPVQVTATQLPPVWISQGNAPPFRVDLGGRQIPVSLARLTDVPIAETAYLRVFLESPILAICDIIDMPGISDPNMPAEVWQRMLAEADGVIWCTHATQAWRQSESAIWSGIPAEVRQRSLLVLTRIDKIVTEADRQRLVKRLNRETAGQFARPCLPVSLIQAVAGRDDPVLWEKSGAPAFLAALRDLVGDSSAGADGRDTAGDTPVTGFDGTSIARTAAVLPRRVRSEGSATQRPDQFSNSAALAAFRAGQRRAE